LQLRVPDLDAVDDKILGAPFVIVFCKGAPFDELVGDAAAAVAGVEIAEALDGFVGDVELRGGVAAGGELEKRYCAWD